MASYTRHITGCRIEDAANTLRRRRDPEAKPVSKMWYPRFREDHPELQKTFLKAVEKSRESWEAGGITDLKSWFERLAETIRIFRIGASECWNADQAGIRVGCLLERVQCLVVRTRRKTRAQVLDPSNRETATLIGTGSAAGDTTPPWIIFKTLPTLDYAYVDANPQMRFAKSESAFSNGEITLEWAQDFNRQSWAKSATVKRRGLRFEEWFGCDEFLRDPVRKYVQYDVPPVSHDDIDGGFRLLIQDGFSGHGIFAFKEYCMKFSIFAIPLPPHSTHFLQPMDVEVFQPMKNAHQKILRQALRKGNSSFSRLDFVRALERKSSMPDLPPKNIISGFEKSGLFPPNAEPGVTYLLKKQMKAKKAVDPAFSSLLPSETRFQRASDTAKQVVEKYRDLLSSPTRAGLREVSKVVIEACLLEETVTMYVDDQRKRIEKRYHEKKRGKRGKPVGDFAHNVSLQELRDQQEEFLAETREKEHRQQIRATRSILLREIEKLKAEWRENKEVVINGVTKKLQLKKWLEHTGKDKEYLSMDTQRSQMTQLLNEKTDGFMIDTQLPPEVSESIRQANYAPKPLNAVDWTALARSDDTIDFNLGGPASDEEDEEEEEGEEDEEDLPVIELPGLRDNRATPPHERSSPPLTPSYESSPWPETPLTPCPTRHQPQQHTSRGWRINDMIWQEEAA
ncbi:hypothetical protein MRS44_018351 [Fusarium solani]|uniref:uncharacterized protein n=1 Tax=Fusarium solani TaxID=169388 RepID=UPI0032C49A7E|nr:hypothetical protein MRS44_018351 [Fusarium solani]